MCCSGVVARICDTVLQVEPYGDVSAGGNAAGALEGERLFAGGTAAGGEYAGERDACAGGVRVFGCRAAVGGWCLRFVGA